MLAACLHARRAQTHPGTNYSNAWNQSNTARIRHYHCKRAAEFTGVMLRVAERRLVKVDMAGAAPRLRLRALRLALGRNR
eukprot:59097-Pyramimonas_sp.AAC.1